MKIAIKCAVLSFAILIVHQVMKADQMMNIDAKIYVSGHNGLVGSAIVRRLQKEGFTTIITRSTKELDLRDKNAVNAFFETERPEYVFLAAAKVGGIKANNDFPADFIYDNLAIEMNVIDAAHRYGAKKLLFLGSSCIYPRDCPQPIKEEYLLTGPLEATNDAYAIAKIAGIKMCQSYNKQHGTNFIACMPTNLYGPNDNFNLLNSHVLPALLAKCYMAKKNNSPEVVIWGTGKPYREFLYVDDLADGCLFLMQNYNGSEIVNIGTGSDVTILQLAHIIQSIVGYQGELVFDVTKPDGTPRKLLDVEKMKKMGWQAQTSLHEGISTMLNWCIERKIFE
ncbi:MAG: GDP-L-fucose synthase [Candidatus Babeliales bacterium]|nr:GDP-L-fucose synthase [Candidatus Babeliales bacterium]